MKKIICIAITLLALTACKDPYVARITDLRLVSIEPRNGYPGDLVVLTGWNFSPDREKNEVIIGDVPALVLEASSSRLQIVLPAHKPGTWPVLVKGPAGQSEPLDFNYLKAPDRIYMATTVVGQQGQRKCVDGVGQEALTYMPTGINKAPDGSIWFTDRGGNKLRRIAQDLTVTTVMDAEIPGAALWQGCFDGNGNFWCNDKANGTLYRYEPSTDKKITVATGMNSPMNVVMDADGNFLVPARDDKKIFKFTPDGAKSVFAEVPEGPSFIAIDPKGNIISATHSGYCLLSIDADGSNQSVIVGDGKKSDVLFDGIDGNPLTASIKSCHGIAFDSKGVMYISDASFHAIRRLTPDDSGNYASGTLETVMGGVKGYTEGKGLNIKFNEPAGLMFYDDETLYICDVQNCLIRKITIK